LKQGYNIACPGLRGNIEELILSNIIVLTRKQPMKKIPLILLALSLVLSACSSVKTIPEPTPDPNAFAILEGLSGSVWLRPEAGAAALQLFEAKDSLYAGQGLSTLAESGAQVNLKDGTIIRLGALTDVVLLETSGADTRISLLNGKVWIILAGGSLEVETIFGNAVVSGSYMGVSFDVENQVMTATCLEGTCSLENENGSTALSAGQASSLKGAGQFPSAAQAMDDGQVSEWVRENPEAAAITGVSVATEEPGVVEEADAASSPTDGAWNSYYFENNCVSGEYANSTWEWNFQRLVQTSPRKIVSDWYIQIPSGEVRSGTIPPGAFNSISETVRSSHYETLYYRYWDTSYSANLKPYVVVLCPDQPRLPSTAPGMPAVPPAAGQELPLLTYWLGNNCLDDEPLGERSHTNWHWTFKMVSPNGTSDPVQNVDVEVIVPPGESRSGELPAGDYLVKDWTEEGSVHTPEYVGRSGELYLNLCPNNQPLPGDPHAADASPTPMPSVGTPAQPVSYTLTVGCSYAGMSGTWHFVFMGPVTTQVDLGLGETRRGTLPSGKYQVYGWPDANHPSNVQAARNWVIDPAAGSTFTFNNCY
jgi:hypothetical protein